MAPDPANLETQPYTTEVLPVAPSKWYLTGFLVPYEAPADQRSDDDSDDALDQVDRAVEGDDDNAPEATSARKAFFPSSMGLSVLVPRDTTELQVRVAWADYAPVVEGEGDSASGTSGGEASESEETEGESDPGARVLGWRRLPREAEVPVALEEGDPIPKDIPHGEGLRVVVSARPVGDTDLVATDSRSVSVFLVNQRQPAPDMTRDAAYVFQAELSLHAEPHFVARPNLRGRHSDDWDERVADLQYADAMGVRRRPQHLCGGSHRPGQTLPAGADRLDAHRRRGEGGAGQPRRCGAGDGGPGGCGVGRGHPRHGGGR